MKTPTPKWYQLGFVVVHRSGYQLIETARHQRIDSINAVSTFFNQTWRELRKEGYHCIRVTIMPYQPKKAKRK